MEFSKQFDTRMETKLRSRVTGGFIVAVLLTVFIGFSSWRSVQLAADHADWVAHTYAVMDALARDAGFEFVRMWTDDARLFGVFYFKL